MACAAAVAKAIVARFLRLFAPSRLDGAGGDRVRSITGNLSRSYTPRPIAVEIMDSFGVCP